MTERTAAVVGQEERTLPGEGGGGVVGLGGGGESGDGDGGVRRAGDYSGPGVMAAFGQALKTLRLRAGLDREEFGRRIGYSAATVASYE